MKLIVLRHGQPDCPKTGLISSVEFQAWVQKYDESSLTKASRPDRELLDLASSASLVVCSSLKRSVDSGKLLANSDQILINSIFNEAELPVNNWRGVNLTSSFWLIILRVLWFLGYSNGAESRSEAGVRATRAAQMLSELSSEHGHLMFVGHGIFNRLLGEALLDLGWKAQRRSQSRYWSYAVYEFQKT